MAAAGTISLDYEERIATGGAGGAPNAQCYVTTEDTGLLYEATAMALPWVPCPGGRAGEMSVPIRRIEKLFRYAKDVRRSGKLSCRLV